MTQPARPGRRAPGGPARGLAWLGGAFAALGLLAILAPVAAGLAATRLLALALMGWGGLGLGLALALRPLPEWRAGAAVFGLLALVGLGALALPPPGHEMLSLVLAAGFLADGVLSILYGLRLSRGLRGWGWMVASGTVALLAGLAVVIGWPDTAAWLLGLLLGADFLTTGLSLLVLRGAPPGPPG